MNRIGDLKKNGFINISAQLEHNRTVSSAAHLLLKLEPGTKSDGRRTEAQTRAKLGELGHLHTLLLYPTSTTASLLSD